MRILLLAILAVLLSACDKSPNGSNRPDVSATTAGAPHQYSPQEDPARPEFEKALAFIHGSNDNPVIAQFIERLKETFPDSPYALIAEAEFYQTRGDLQNPATPEHVRGLIKKSFLKSRAIPDAYVTLTKLDLAQGRERSAAAIVL